MIKDKRFLVIALAPAPAINKNPAEAGSVYLRLDRSMHLEPFRCRYGFLRQREFQHAVVVLGLGGRFVDLLTERERALDLAVIALGTKHRFAVLDVFFVLHFRGYRNFVAVNSYADLFLLDAGQFRQHLVLLLVLGYVHAELRRRGRTRLRVRQPHGDATEQVLEGILERIKACDVYHFVLLWKIQTNRRWMTVHPLPL